MSDINVIKMTYMSSVNTQYKEKEKEKAIDKPNATYVLHKHTHR